MGEIKENVAVVLGSNIHWAPYFYRYEKILEDKGKAVDLIIWNREHISETVSANTNLIEYLVRDKSDNKNPLKVFKFIDFTRFVCNVLTRRSYDKVIFLGTHGCAPVFGAMFLKKHFYKRYWIDIRDYQYEWFKPFYLLERISINNSYKTILSSAGYKRFLPQYDYGYMHNVDPNMDSVKKRFSHKKSSKIRISFIGNVRYFNECVKVVNVFANDFRFELRFCGAGSERIASYCLANGIENVFCKGRFEPDETVNFYNETDIINNVYGNDSLGLTTALSNKLYYGIALNLPILVCRDTYMEEITKKYGFGIVFENKKCFADELYSWYQKFIINDNEGNFKQAWEDIQKDENKVNLFFEEFLRI